MIIGDGAEGEGAPGGGEGAQFQVKSDYFYNSRRGCCKSIMFFLVYFS
jgi:hypothetical protein